MTKKHFNAILAKNNIAREIADCRAGMLMNLGFIQHELEAIESYIGQANQPTVSDIIEYNSKPNSRFRI
jgi:hypothetical protein